MPRRFTMETLVGKFKDFSDLENDDHVTDSGWKSRASMVYGDLYSEVALTGYRFFEYTTDVTADGSEYYDEPVDHYSTAVIVCVLDSSGRLSPPLVELPPGDERAYAGQTGSAVGYQLIDDRLYLYPKPSSGTYRWRYVPQPPDLSAYADDDVIDVVTPDGEAFLIWGTVALGKSKSESDLQFALAQQAAARERLQVWAANRAQEGRMRVEGVELDDRIRPVGWNG